MKKILFILLIFCPTEFVLSDYVIDKCYEYEKNGYKIKSGQETCIQYHTKSLEVKDKAYESCTKVLGAFSFTETVKDRIKIRYNYFCKLNS